MSSCGIPILIGALALSFFPESPKFLMSQGRNDEALEVLKTMYSLNKGEPRDNYPVRMTTDSGFFLVEKESLQKNFFFGSFLRISYACEWKMIVVQYGNIPFLEEEKTNIECVKNVKRGCVVLYRSSSDKSPGGRAK